MDAFLRKVLCYIGLLAACAAALIGSAGTGHAGLVPGIPHVPYVETLDVARWPDLTEEHRQKLVHGALDALDREGDPIVRALSAYMLALVATIEPGRALNDLRIRRDLLRKLQPV